MTLYYNMIFSREVRRKRLNEIVDNILRFLLTTLGTPVAWGPRIIDIHALICLFIRI